MKVFSLVLFFHLTIKWNFQVSGLVITTALHQLFHVTPTKHPQLHFLNEERLKNPELIFWNGLGGLDERVFILCKSKSAEGHRMEFEKHGMTINLAYSLVKITYVESNPNHPNTYPTKTRLEEEILEDEEADENEKALSASDADDNIEEKLLKGQTDFQFNDTIMAERLIATRKNKFSSGNGDTLEAVGMTVDSPGLVQVKPILSFDNRHLSINSGILYRIQGVQTLIIGNLPPKVEDNGNSATQSDASPRVGEYMFASFKNERDGYNPYITAEETRQWKNDDYVQNRTKGSLWMFVPSEKEKYYEIRNRNYPASLVVWGYDKAEGEFVLYVETRRQYMKRYQKEGTLRYRALFSLQRVSETYRWELVKERPKYYMLTYHQNHVYLYESIKRDCSMLIVRNSAEKPYMPDKTDTIGRPLDMFYITRINLTGDYQANIFSFLYEKSIVDVFATSAEQNGSVQTLRHFQIANRGPSELTHYIFDDVMGHNEVQFKFQNTFKSFQWVTLEAHLPSLGIAPVVMSGAIGKNTDTNIIERTFSKEYEIQDKIVLESGSWVNASVVFQKINQFENPFSAIMEVTEPADRLYFDKQGKPRFIRMSLPGKMVENSWSTKANFRYERVIERREVAFVVQVKGILLGSYGLRAFVKKSQMDYPAGIISCGEKANN